jgi:hypothetical protein
MSKIFLFTVSLDEGVSQFWHFKADNELAICQHILDNIASYEDLLDYLPIGKKINELTAALLLRLIENSSIDGDSSYGFQIFELTESDIVPVLDSNASETEVFNPNFANSEQIKSLVKTNKSYRSQQTDLLKLTASDAVLSDAELDFIQKLQEQRRYSSFSLRDEKSLFNFIAPIVYQIKLSAHSSLELNSDCHNYPLKAVINGQTVSTQVDYMIYKGYDYDCLPLFILEANWHRPHSIMDYDVILA